MQCWFVVPPAKINLFLTIPDCLHPTIFRDAWSHTVYKIYCCKSLVNVYIGSVLVSKYNLFHRLLPHIRGNVGFVFTKEDLTEIRDLLLANKVSLYTLNTAFLYYKALDTLIQSST